MRALMLLALGFAAVAASADDRPVTLQSLLAEMTDVTTVARWPQPEYTCRQSSSYDRRSKTPADADGWFANTDNMDGLGAELKWETHAGRREAVLMDVDGPGAVVRFWSGGQHPKGNVRFYLDGAEQPAIEAPLYDLLAGKGFVPPPLAIQNAGEAINLYLPIPYARHCKITYDEQRPGNPQAPPPGRWYNIEYRTYPPGTKVETFSMDAFRAAAGDVERARKSLQEPAVPAGLAAKPLAPISLEAGRESSIALPPGPAAVRELQLSVTPESPDLVEEALRGTVLRLSFDGEETVWCPAGDFFGSGIGVNPLQSWYRTVAPDGTMTCRFVMPYQRSAKLAFSNCSRHRVVLRGRVLTGDWKWDERSLHFHANWRQQRQIPTRPFQDWNYLTATGKGLYLGDTLALFNPARTWWGEGDEKIFVDNEKFPSHFGTGSEDYYGYAWGNPALFQGPFSNQPRAGAGNLGHTTNTRVRSLDAIPFKQSLQMGIEIWHWADCKVDYAAATYWYARPGATCNRPPAPDEAAAELRQLPGRLKLAGALECDQLQIVAKTPGLPADTQDLSPYAGAWSGDSHLFVRATKPGDFIELRIPAAGAGAKKLTLHATKSYDYAVVRFSVNGKPVEKESDLYSAQPAPSGPIELGVFEPKDGAFVLRAEVVGTNPASRGPKYYFGLDAVLLSAP